MTIEFTTNSLSYGIEKNFESTEFIETSRLLSLSSFSMPGFFCDTNLECSGTTIVTETLSKLWASILICKNLSTSATLLLHQPISTTPKATQKLSLSNSGPLGLSKHPESFTGSTGSGGQPRLASHSIRKHPKLTYL